MPAAKTSTPSKSSNRARVLGCRRSCPGPAPSLHNVAEHGLVFGQRQHVCRERERAKGHVGDVALDVMGGGMPQIGFAVALPAPGPARALDRSAKRRSGLGWSLGVLLGALLLSPSALAAAS